MVFGLPPSPVENIFVGYVMPHKNNEDPTCFLETLVDEMEREQKKVQDPNHKEKSFQGIFETVNKKLKGKVSISKIDNCGQKPIYLFYRKVEKDGTERLLFYLSSV
jgi:hypothetical protein